jgi:hypothetical protein
VREWRRWLLVALPAPPGPDPGRRSAGPCLPVLLVVQDERQPRAQFARGKYGQYIYVVAASDLVLVRLGWDVGYRHWPQLLSDLARRLNESASGKAS